MQPYEDEQLEPVELGASIFVKANKNMWRASDEFGFERADFDDNDDSMGIWDGTKFLLTVRIIITSKCVLSDGMCRLKAGGGTQSR